MDNLLPIKRPEAWLVSLQKNDTLQTSTETTALALPPPQKITHFVPWANLSETLQYIEITLLVGNLVKESLTLQLIEKWLIITGNTLSLLATEEKCYMQEIPEGNFEKRLLLTQVIDTEEVRVTYQDGILRIRLNKSMPKQITNNIVAYW